MYPTADDDPDGGCWRSFFHLLLLTSLKDDCWDPAHEVVTNRFGIDARCDSLGCPKNGRANSMVKEGCKKS